MKRCETSGSLRQRTVTAQARPDAPLVYFRRPVPGS